MSSFTKEVQSIVRLIDFKIGEIDQELTLVEEYVADDLAMIVSKLDYPADKLPDITPYKNRLVTVRTISLKRAKRKLTDLRNQLTFALEANAT